MDQAFTLRSLMKERKGDPFAALSLYPRTQFLVPFQWKDAALRVLSELAAVCAPEGQRTLLLVDGFDPKHGLTRNTSQLYQVGTEKLSSRLDDELAEVIRLGQIWVVLPYLESESDLDWVTEADTVLVHGVTDDHIVSAYRQLRTLMSRCGVKKLDALVLAGCVLRDALRAHSRLEEMGNRFLGAELGFLGKIHLNPNEFLLHWEEGGDYQTHLKLIAEKLKLQPAQYAPTPVAPSAGVARAKD